MLVVKEVGSKEEWTKNLQKCNNVNIFSTWEWGDFKSHGWRVERLAFYKGTSFVGQTQIAFKEKLGYRLGWSSSGISFVEGKYLKDIIDSLKNHYNFLKTVIRFNFFDNAIGSNCFTFDSIEDLKKVSFSVNSGYTVRYNFCDIEKVEPALYTKNNRYYLKKALKIDQVAQVEDFEIDNFKKVHDDMSEVKSKLDLVVSKDELVRLKDIFGDRLKMFTVRIEGEIVCASLVILFDGHAYYFLAGSNDKGRSSYSAFLMIDYILKFLKDSEVKKFDFGGISPFLQSVSGINRFKMGFGGEVTHYIGERNLTDSKWLNFIFNIIVKVKLKDRS